LIELLQDDPRRAQMGLAGRRIAEERFDEQQVFDRILAEYERLLR
jgi:glycosyltransferase involved in cell wall biosynthesis